MPGPVTLKHVRLQFPTDSQVRYVERVPERGERVFGLAGEEYVVADVTREGEGFVVVCRRRDESAQLQD